MTATTLTENALADVNVYESKRRDKYGRTVLHLEYLCRTLVVVATLPKTSDRRYLVNEWDNPERGEAAVTYFDTRKAAVAFARERALHYRNLRAANVAAGLGNVQSVTA